jgi:hypothetical protein
MTARGPKEPRGSPGRIEGSGRRLPAMQEAPFASDSSLVLRPVYPTHGTKLVRRTWYLDFTRVRYLDSEIQILCFPCSGNGCRANDRKCQRRAETVGARIAEKPL